MSIDSAAQFIATHALLLLLGGILLMALALAAVLGAARLAVRYRHVLWEAVDFVVPGRGLLPSAYLAAHLLLALLALLATLGFLALAQEVFEDEAVAAFDVALARALFDQTTPSWRQLFAGITTLGNGAVITAAAGAIAVPVFATRGRLVGLVWVFSLAGGGLLNYGLKIFFERARPPFADPELAARSFSFPSGHSMLTFVFCGMAAYLLIRSRRSWPLAISLSTLVLAWSVLMAFSRMYLGQHYLSDVVAGLFAGAAWVAACVAGMEVVLRRSARDRAAAQVD